MRLTVLHVAVLLALCAAGCFLRATPPPPPPPPPPAGPRIPHGCEGDLSGDYTHAQTDRYRYRASDDGGELVLALERTLLDGGQVLSDPDAGPQIYLRRGDGFRGATLATEYAPNGALCPVTFETELTACDDGGLTLRAERSTPVDETCRAPPSKPRQSLLVHRLVRLRPEPVEAPDAGDGAVDGGAQDARVLAADGG